MSILQPYFVIIAVSIVFHHKHRAKPKGEEIRIFKKIMASLKDHEQRNCEHQAASKRTLQEQIEFFFIFLSF